MIRFINGRLKNQFLSSNQHLAIFVPSMRGGGAERVMAMLANWFVQNGHSVDLVLAQCEGPYLEELDSRVNIVNLNSKRVALAFWPLVSYLRKSRPRVMLTALVHANILGILAREVSRVQTRLVLSERGAPSVSSDGTPLKPWWAFAIRKLYPKADAITVVSNGVGRELVEDFGIDPSRLFTVHNPVDIDRIQQMSVQDEVLHEWIHNRNLHVYLAVGRLTEVKGFDVLLHAFTRVQEAVPSRLIILGEGPLRPVLEELARTLGIQDKVDLVGFQSNPYAWMRKSDTFVLSSFSEGLPNALLQAMACGTQVVSTDCRHGAGEILKNGELGTLVPVGNPKRLAEAMISSAATNKFPDVVTRIEDFRLDKIARKYAQVLKVPIAPEGSK